MSALTSIADIPSRPVNVRFVPKPDVSTPRSIARPSLLRRIYHLPCTAPRGRCGTEPLLERTGKRRFRFVSDLFGDPDQRIAGVPQLLPGDLPAPFAKVW